MRKALGRGIDSLITKVQNNDISGDIVQRFPLEMIKPNPFQPRRNFDGKALEELAESIKERGLIQPISVWKDSDSEYHFILAGERRWRAAKLAGLVEIEVIVKKDLTEEQKLGLSLLENIQREDLNAIDTALAYQKLMVEFGATQADIAQRVHKSRAAVSNTLRLLELDEDILQGIQNGRIDAGHARALISIPDRAKRREAYQRIVAEKLSVRDVERIAQGFHSDRPKTARKPRAGSRKTPEAAQLEAELERHLGTKVEICHGPGPQNGKILIHYFSLDDLDRVTHILKR
ncbi:MAG: chromosome partitioning protein ParB [Elusimicrobia bacterium CG08_land_8_20_14_0_20_59_10]|nr:MAG: chromosome partitioning protein ParB [Elusimicrobia bacterium CG08_land_8_20_14_0_20_59_10]